MAYLLYEEVMSVRLYALINTLSLVIFCWSGKKANVVPIHKKGD